MSNYPGYDASVNQTSKGSCLTAASNLTVANKPHFKVVLSKFCEYIMVRLMQVHFVNGF